MTEQSRPGGDGGYNGHQPAWGAEDDGGGHVPPMPPTAPHLGRPAGGYAGYPQPMQGPGVDAYGQPHYYPVPAAPKALSIASLCCGVAAFLGFGFFLLPQLAAVVLGHLALLREPGGRGLAIAGLVLGYVAMAITLLVIIVLGVAFSNADFVTR